MDFLTPDITTEIPSTTERARVTIARHIKTLEAYGELCAMVLDDPDAAERYVRYVQEREQAA